MSQRGFRHRAGVGLAPSYLAPILIWYHTTMAGLDACLERRHRNHARGWRKRHLERRGLTPHVQVTITEHAAVRFQERWRPTKPIDECATELQQLAQRATWRHTGVLEAGGIRMPVAFVGSQYRVTTVLP